MTNHKHDRDATVDRLLAGMARGPEESAGPCLDVETLAAWADGALSAGELAAAQAHAADCGRCQAVLAVMAKTLPATPAPAPHAWRMPSLRWLVPLTAAAATAVISIFLAQSEHPVNVRQVSQAAEPASASPPAPAAPDAGALPAEKTAPSRARREQGVPAQDKGVETDQRAAAPPVANAVPDAPARSADARLENVQAAAPVSAAAAPPAAAPAARALAFGAADTIVVSSNSASRWRIRPGGVVQSSSDGGATWRTQNTGVSETLSAGSSPSPSVCWLVGPGGIVLLSTDGRAWKRVGFPETVPLVGVRATDDQTATVTTVDGREFATEDGGRTWARATGR